MSDITVIGLGVMGSALAQTLLQSGYKVTVWNRTPNKAADLADRGAITAVSCSEAIAASPLIVICIKSHSDTRQLLESAENLKSKNIIELSTGSAPEAESLCSGQLIPDSKLSFSSAAAGANPPFAVCGLCQS